MLFRKAAIKSDRHIKNYPKGKDNNVFRLCLVTY